MVATIPDALAQLSPLRDTGDEWLGTVLAGIITCCWLAVGIGAVAAVAARATKASPRRRARRPGGRPERGRVVLGALGLTGVALPLLLAGWSGWPWSAANLALVGVGVGGARLAARPGMVSQRLSGLAVLACLAGVGFAVYAVWRLLLLLGGGGTVLALCLGGLVVVLLAGTFAVSVREAATRTLAWCRHGSGRRWLLVAALCAVTLVLPGLAGLPWWLGPPGVMLLAASVGMFQLGLAEGGDGHALSLLSSALAGLYGAWIIATGVMSWQRLF